MHPCLECGACCRVFRVSFPDWELRSLGGHVPDAFTRASAYRDHREMFKLGGQCSALEGEVGRGVRCHIYEDRPSVCRAFTPSWEDGERHELCDEARAAIGLRPLTPEDFPVAPSGSRPRA